MSYSLDGSATGDGGSNQYLTASGNPVSAPLSGFTMAIWCKTSDSTPSATKALMTLQNAPASDYVRLSLGAVARDPTGSINTGTSVSRTTDGDIVWSNYWFLSVVRVVGDGTTYLTELYTDGYTTYSTGSWATPNSATGLTKDLDLSNSPAIGIGVTLGTATTCWLGEVCHATIWSSVLTDLQVASLADTAPPNVDTGNVIAYWPLLSNMASHTDFDPTSTYDLSAPNGATLNDGDGPSITPYTSGASIDVTNLSDDTLDNGQTSVTITGSGFKTSQGTGKVIISPTDDVTDTNAVRQFVTTWSSDTSITFTAIRGTLQAGTQYLFVVNDDGDSNTSGYPVSFNGLTPIILRWNM